MNRPKKSDWKRWLLAGVSVLVIVGMWVHKSLAGKFAEMSAADALPMIAVSVAVTGFKAMLITAVLMAARWIAGKVRR